MSDTLADVSMEVTEGERDIPILFMHEVERTYRQGDASLHILNGAELAIWTGQSVALVAPSGAGKSTLLHIAGLLEHPDHGDVFIDGRATAILPDHDRTRIRRSEIGFVYQSHHLLPEFTALENVMLPMQRLGRLSAPEIRKRAEELLASLGLADQRRKLPKQLSGGQSQRVAIARALANDPLLILADEPTGNLDTAASANVQHILRDLAHQHDRAVVTVTHDTGFAGMADRVVTIVDGKIVGT